MYTGLASSPGPFPAFQCRRFQHATLKSWEWAWGQGYTGLQKHYLISTIIVVWS